jgi:SOS-response transcriptional repressor LexA
MSKPTGATKRHIIQALVSAEEEQRPLGVQNLATLLQLSKGTVSEHLGTLEDQKFIQRNSLFGVGIVTDRGRIWAGLPLRGVPMFGAIAAGFALAWDSEAPTGYIQAPDLDTQRHSAFRVRGDSMTHLHICEGDVIVVRRTNSAEEVRNGEIVAVAIPEDTDVVSPGWTERLHEERHRWEDQGIMPDLNYITLKRLIRQGGLAINNTALEGMDVLFEGRVWSFSPVVFQIIGVLVRVIRDY